MKTRSEESAFGVLYGNEAESPATLRENFEKLVARLERRRDRREYVAVVITGDEPGVGKSTLGIHLSRRLDPEFDLSHFAYRAFDLRPIVHRVGETRHEQFSMIQVDEPEGLIAKGGRKDEQIIEIASTLGTCRKNGIGIVLVAPQLWWYDALVRGGLVPYWLHVEKKGVARVHRKWRGVKYRTSQSRYEYDRSTLYPKIGFRSLAGDPMFVRYEAEAIDRNWAEYGREGRPSGGRRRSTAAPSIPLDVPERVLPPTGPARAPLVARCGKAWGSTYDLRRHEARCPECRNGQLTVASSVTGTK